MSVWTHVVGSVRVDGLPGIANSRIEDVRKVLGRIITFDDLCRQEGPQDALETTLPMGSEGSMSYHIVEYGKGLCWLTVVVWGDLRDYDSPESIIEWFKKLCEKLNDPTTGQFWVRDAIIRATSESSENVLTWGCGVGDDEPEAKSCPTCGGNPSWCHRGSCAFVPGGRLNQCGPCDDAKTCANHQSCPDCKKEPVGGRCCDCGYEGAEETECPKREDKTHCEHWWDGKGS